MDWTRFFTTSADTSLALPATHEPYLVAISYVIAALAGFAFLRFAGRIGELSQSVLRFGWMAAGALTMGLGVWAMHFVGMLAYKLPIPVGYDPLITTLSVVPAILGSAIALHCVARPRVSMRRLAVGAVALGAGIGAMHYTGMAALHFDAYVSYDPALFTTSIVVAIALAFAALFTTLWSMRQDRQGILSLREVLGAAFLGLAVAGMHYTAMTSAFCFADSSSGNYVGGIESGAFAAMTTIIATLVLIFAISGVIFDRRLQAEIQRREQVQAQLLQAQKMEALGNLAGGIAHDFNNMLLPIVALTELTIKDLPDDHESRENLSTVLEAARHAQYLVNQVMVFSRQDQHEMTNLDLAATVKNGVQLLREELPPEIEIVESIDPSAGSMLANREQIEALIMMLGMNAADAMGDDSGRIDISLTRVKPGQNPVHFDAKSACARLRVRDNGRGMDADTLGRIFNPFFTTKPVGDGTGLGLAMADGIIRRFNGIADVKSAPGAGTTFDIYFPLLADSLSDRVADAA